MSISQLGLKLKSRAQSIENNCGAGSPRSLSYVSTIVMPPAPDSQPALAARAATGQRVQQALPTTSPDHSVHYP